MFAELVGISKRRIEAGERWLLLFEQDFKFFKLIICVF